MAAEIAHVSRAARLMVDSELPVGSIRGLLLADVDADLLQFELDGRYGVTSIPEVFTGEVSFSTTKPGESHWSNQ